MNTRELSPALAGSVALHLGVAVLLLFSWQRTRDLKIGAVVPVTIVSNAPAAELSPALEAPEAQTAQAETLTPEAPPTPLPPAPQPTPDPTPQPKPAPPKAAQPAPQKPAPKPEKSLDLDALAASVSKMAKASGGKPSSAAKGPVRSATAPQSGAGLSAAAQSAANNLGADLERRWNANCVYGAQDVKVKVRFTIGANGAVVEDFQDVLQRAPNTLEGAALVRAIQAVKAASPFRGLPRELYGQTIVATFDSRNGCR